MKDAAHKDTHIALVTHPTDAVDKTRHVVVEVTPAQPTTLSFPFHSDASKANITQARDGYRLAVFRFDPHRQCGQHEAERQKHLARDL